MASLQCIQTITTTAMKISKMFTQVFSSYFSAEVCTANITYVFIGFVLCHAMVVKLMFGVECLVTKFTFKFFFCCLFCSFKTWKIVI